MTKVVRIFFVSRAEESKRPSPKEYEHEEEKNAHGFSGK